MKLKLLSIGLAVVLAHSCPAGIFYDEGARCIRVVDFPKEAPCTLARLLSMDALFKWGKVAYDRQTDTYTIAGDLWIGTNDGSDTYFQVGSEAQPRETLVMKGNLVVCPNWIEKENPDKPGYQPEKSVNRLTLGVPAAKSVTAALKFEGGGETRHSLFIGGIPTGPKDALRGRGGQLHVHSSIITSLVQKPGFEFGAPSRNRGMMLTGERVVLDHATLSWIAGFMTYGMSDIGRVAHTVFERGGAAIINGRHDLIGCVFRNCGTAILDYGSLDAVLTDCAFEGNEHNWALTFSDKGLVCVDCTWDAPSKGNLYRSWENRQTKKKQYPSFVSKRHVVVEVVDEQGQPVPGAQVAVKCEQGALEAVENGKQTTNKLGRTAVKGAGTPILLTEVIEKATDVENQPQVTPYTYVIEASAGDFAPVSRAGFRPLRSWEVVRLVLKKR